MRTGKREIKNGVEFNHLFPKAQGNNIVTKQYAELSDTVDLMQRVIIQTLNDTKQIAKLLKANTLEQSCANVWNFCFKHLQYEKDERNKEQVRRPARTWQDRIKGVDCDCMTVFISSILTNMGIPVLIRLTRYKATDFEHVYPVALVGNKTIIMDAVVYQFNYEVPYTQKKDIPMELQYLNGFGDDEDFDGFNGNDDDEESEYDFLLGLDGKEKRQQKKEVRQQKREDKKANKPPIKERVKKVVHAVNRVNPATALLRAGILASMKLNVMHVAGKLRYAYWTDQQALQNNVEMPKFQKLKAVRIKLEKIFFGAGGKPENLKQAILTGRGNRDKLVALNGFSLGEVAPSPYEHDLIAIIGQDAYFDEFSDVKRNSGVNGFNGLGEPVTATTIAAASGIIGAIAGLLKTIGSIFKKGSKQEQQQILQENTDKQEEKTSPYNREEIAKEIERSESTDSAEPRNYPVVMPSDNLPQTTDSSDDDVVDMTDQDLTDNSDVQQRSMQKSADDPQAKSTSGGGIVQWVKDNKLASFAIAGLAIGGIAWIMTAKNKAKERETTKEKFKNRGSYSLDGVDGLDGTRRRKRKPNSQTKSINTKQKSKRKGAKTPPRNSNGRYIRKVELL